MLSWRLATLAHSGEIKFYWKSSAGKMRAFVTWARRVLHTCVQSMFRVQWLRVCIYFYEEIAILAASVILLRYSRHSSYSCKVIWDNQQHNLFTRHSTTKCKPFIHKYWLFSIVLFYYNTNYEAYFSFLVCCFNFITLLTRVLCNNIQSVLVVCTVQLPFSKFAKSSQKVR